MAKGTCACCDRRDMTIVAMRLCGRCYAGKNSGRIFWSVAHEQWMARIEADAERYNCVWQGDPALEPADIEPMGDGEFAAAGAPVEAVAVVEPVGAHEVVEEPVEPVDATGASDPLAGFETYQRLTPPPAEPCLTVQRSGRIKFGRAAVREFVPAQVSHVRLHYDRASARVALELLSDDGDGSALKITGTRNGDMHFHGAGFFRAMGIAPEPSHYPLSELRPGLLVACMGGEAAA
jgi:hypothetical protein